MYALQKLDAETNTFVDAGIGRTFDEKRFAAEYAQSINLKPFKIVDASQDDSWKERELARFQSGQYDRVFFSSFPWYVSSEYFHDHFLHVSENNPGKVAYTENAEKAGRTAKPSLRRAST